MKIYAKLVTVLLAFIIISVFFVSYMVYRNSEKLIEDQIFARLNDVADHNERDIGLLLDSIRVSLLVMERRDIYKRPFTVLEDLDRSSADRSNPSYIKAAEDIDKRLAVFKANLGCLDIMLTNAEGRIIYVSNADHDPEIGTVIPDRDNVFRQTEAGIFVGDIHRTGLKDSPFALSLTGRIYGEADKVLGLIRFEVDMNIFYDLLRSKEKVGSTREALIVIKGPASEVIFVSPLKYSPLIPLERKAAIGSNYALPAQKALLGERGSGFSVDYRGKAVLAAWKPVPSLGCGLVHKVDVEEAFQPIRKLRILLIVVILVTIFSSIFAVFAIARSISDPIHELHKGIEQIGSGNLSHKVGTDSKDEIGQLSRAFDAMVGDLQKTTISKDYLDNIMGSMADSLIVVNPDARIATVNKAICELLGYKEEELIGKDVTLLFSEEEEEEEEEEEAPFRSTKLRKLVKEGSVSDYEANFKTKDGKIIPILLSGAVMRRIDCPGPGPVDDCEEFKKKGVHCEKIQGVVVVAKDITERKHSEDALRESDKRFMDVMYSSSDAILLIDGNIFVDCNEATARMLGYPTRKEFMMTHPSKLSPDLQPDGQKSFDKAEKMMKIAMEKGYNQFEWVQRKASGEDFLVEVALTPISFHGKSIIYCVWRDITERKNAEVALLESEKKYRELFDTAGDPIIIHDAKGHILAANSATIAQYGYTPAEIRSMTVAMLDSSEDVPRAPERIAKIITEGVNRFETVHLRKDGSRVSVDVSAMRVEWNNTLAVMSICRDITERKKQEEKYKLMIESSIDGFWLVDPQSNIIDVNDSYCRMTGYSREEMLKMKVSDLEVNESPEDVAAHTRRIRETGSDSFETRHKRKDGSIIDTAISVVCLRYSDQMFAFVRDITERKRAEMARQARINMVGYETSMPMPEFLKKCLDEAEAATGSLIGFYHIVADDEKSLVLQAWSTKTEQVFCKAEGKGMHYDLDKAGVWVDCVRQRQPVIHNDYESLPRKKGMPAGHAKVVRELTVPIFRKGRIVAVIGVGNKAVDYTDEDIETLNYMADVMWELVSHKKAAEELRESEQKFKVFADFTIAWEYWIDPKGNIVYMSPSSEYLTGYRPEEFIADPLLLGKIIHPDNEQVKGLIHKSDRLLSLEFRVSTKDGQERWIAYVSKGAFAADGSYLGIRASATDITMRKIAEKELWKAKAQADIANQAKSQFLAHISHEIRTPLNAVIGFAEMLEGTPLNDVQKDYSNVIRTSGENLLALIGDILDISKIEAKQLTFENIDFDLENMVESVIHMIMPKMKNSRVELEYEFADDVPRYVNGDPTRLRQVLLNLLVNSVKFTEEGEIRLSVSLDPQDAEGRTVRFSVKDTGIGIPKEKQEAIFDRFVQADASTTRKYGGTGLGLPISRSLLELMGGNLSVISETGKGSEFIVTLKLNKASSVIAEGLTPIPYGQLEGKKVAIVGENEKDRRDIEGYCRYAKMDILYSGPSGEEAVQKILGISVIPHAIIYSAMLMPGTGGREFVKRVRARDDLKGVKLVVVDPSAVPGAAKKAREDGFDAYISKPVLRQNFIKIIQTVLGVGRADGRIVTVHMAEDLSCKGIKVLIAEDISASQKLLSLVLKRLGCEADIVSNGKEAVEKLRNGTYDIVLMDVQMPVMDGIEATKVIRSEINQTVPIIALTAAAMEDDRAKSMGAGMNDYLTKPIKAGELKKKLLVWTGRGGGRHPEL
jgi:PAS domain S-box-containing protein